MAENFFDLPLNLARNQNVKRVFFLRLGAVGDLLVATAALSETLERFARAEVWVAGPQIWTELLLPQMWPRVTAIWVMPDKSAMSGVLWIHNQDQSDWQPMQNEQTLEEILKNCDASVNLRPESLRYARPMTEARVAVRLGTSPWWSKHHFTHWSPWLGRDPIVHERDRLLHIVRAPRRLWFPLGLSSASRRRLRALQTNDFARGPKADPHLVHQPDEKIESVARQWRERVLPRLTEPDREVARQLSGCDYKQYVLINPTASRWEKAWPKEKFRQLCAQLEPEAEPLGCKFVLLGAPTETEWLKEVQGQTNFALVQAANLRQLMDVVGGARAVIANASSVQFFANSLGVPVFVLLGRTFPARWGPLGPKDDFICGQLPKPRPKNIFLEDYRAFDSLSVGQVYERVRPWLARTVEGPAPQG